MKKMIFSAIAMIAFAGTASAQTSAPTISDAVDCSNKADAYIRTQGPISREYAAALRSAYYNGCLDAKKTTNNSTAADSVGIKK